MSKPTISRDSKLAVAFKTAEVVLESAIRGATWGAVTGLVFPKTCGGPLRLARGLAAGMGAGDGIRFAMEEVRGKEDVQSCMIGGFGSGAAYFKALGYRGPVVVISGLFIGLGCGALVKISQYVESGTKTRHSQSD